MFRNYLVFAFRNLSRNKAVSFINVLGLAVGMGTAMIIGLWVGDELSFNKYHFNYESISQVMLNQTFGNNISTDNAVPLPLKAELQNNFGNDFKRLSLATGVWNHLLSVAKVSVVKQGMYAEPDFPGMFSLKMIRGTNQNALHEPSDILLSESAAKSLFAGSDPINKVVRLDNGSSARITGIYEEIPNSSDFYGVEIILPWSLLQQQDWVKNSLYNWGNNSFQLFVQISHKTTIAKIDSKIRDLGKKHYPQSKPEYFLQPMSEWHLYSEFKDGKNEGGRITYVWLFSFVGMIVLLLACINFTNLSTARSGKRAKEIGIRKTNGSVHSQLISQFLSESVFISAIAFAISILLVSFALPLFNEVSGKEMSILWTSPIFWILGISFTLVTGLLAGLYPAFYLSSIQPLKVLKGTFKAHRLASLPRKVLVTFQFTVSIALIISTITVYRQINFAKDRPLGYHRAGLLQVGSTDAVIRNYGAFKNDLLKTGVALEMSASSSPTTGIWENRDDFTWEGKDPRLLPLIGLVSCTDDFGKSVGWQVIEGRDFSKDLKTDSASVIINEAAAKLTGLKNIIGKNFTDENNKRLHVVGVVKNMVMESPYSEIKPTFFVLGSNFRLLNIKLAPEVSTAAALNKVQAVYKAYNPDIPFVYKFADDEFSRKFDQEERVGKLASMFALLAIFISCLGLFGLASFIAEQRVREIGVRKLLGASVRNLWQMLSKEFMILVVISCFVAVPLSYYFMFGWLQQYQYRTDLPWWIFATAGLGAFLITLLTVSYETFKAARANPVDSLRSE